MSDSSETGVQDPVTEVFVAHRNLLFTVAYEILGSAADAEDAVQETWLRWRARNDEQDRLDLEPVRDPRAFLVQIAARQALTHLRTLSRRKESYVGPWLPEPLATAPDVAEDVELAESVSTAMLMVLETLTPTERAVFVLREVFAVGYDEIARAVDKSEAAVRQIAHRARQHVAARRPRGAVSAAEARAVLDAFRRSLATGDLQSLLDVLSPDVVAMGDGGGLVQAARRPVAGADKVIRFLAGGLRKAGGEVTAEPAYVNGSPALIMRVDGAFDGVVTVRIDDGLVTELYYVRNPNKLGRLDEPTELSRAAAD